MYYYGGYQGYGGGCGYPANPCGGYGTGYGYGSGAAIVLVLFILLVIVIGSRFVAA
ncbi:MAG: sporulation protein YjcZ [Bacilli bacterium]